MPFFSTHRLSLQALTSVDLLKQLNPQPEGCVPPLALPSWHFMPLEKKIPLLQSPKGLFYYTRGKLGQMVDITYFNAPTII